MRIQLDGQGKLKKKPDSPSAQLGAVQVYSGGGVQVTPDGWSVNTSQPPFQRQWHTARERRFAVTCQPCWNGWGDKFQVPVPAQRQATIGDRLSDRGIDWAWYAGAYKAALQDGQPPHDPKRRNHLPTAPKVHPTFKRITSRLTISLTMPLASLREKHLKDGEDFLKDIANGTLPAVSFYKPAGRDTQHPSYTDVMTGDTHIHEVLTALKQSPQWARMLVVVTYDENGGYWDHVPLPKVRVGQTAWSRHSGFQRCLSVPRSSEVMSNTPVTTRLQF
jgi:phospholipase C